MPSEYDVEFAAKPREFLEKNIIIINGGVIRSTTAFVMVQRTIIGEDGNTPKTVVVPKYKKIITGTFTLTESKSIKAGGRAKRVLELDYVDINSVNNNNNNNNSNNNNNNSNNKIENTDLKGINADGIKAYWLAYESTNTKRAILSTDAYFMFTANLNGCTFAHGSQTATGHILVGHSNAQDQAGDVKLLNHNRLLNQKPPGQGLTDSEKKYLDHVREFAQAEAQENNLYDKLKKKDLKEKSLHVVSPSAYNRNSTTDEKNIYSVNDKFCATIIGHRMGSRWSFYCQRWTTIDGTHQAVLRDVIDV